MSQSQMDPLLYNNCVLTHNIAMLSNLPIQQLVVERDKIKKEFEDYEMMKDLRNESTNFKSRREHYDDIDTILQLKGDELYRIDHSP